MDWTEAIDAYCERTGPEFWSEPINAITNGAFLIAALVMAWRLRGQSMPLAWALVAILAAIGTGSFLFHTHATAWAAMADVVPIAVFVLVYLFGANRVYLGWPVGLALIGTLGFLPFAAGAGALMSGIPVIGVSAVYWPIPVLIAIYAVILRNRSPGTARGLAIGAGLLTLSLLARSVDEPLCDAIPVGTHFLWHILNAIMLAWMIEVYRTHMLAIRPVPG